MCRDVERRRSRGPISTSGSIIAQSVNSTSMLFGSAHFGMRAHGCGSCIRRKCILKAYPSLDEADLRLMPYTRNKGIKPFLSNNFGFTIIFS